MEMAHEKLLAWIDTETTGLYPEQHRILEIAVEVTDQHLRVVESFEAKILLPPEDIKMASPEALLVNGYNETEWASGMLPNIAFWKKIQALTSKRILAGQNIAQFDAPFVTAEMHRVGLKPQWDRRMLDTTTDCIRAMYEFDIRHPKGYATAGLEFVYTVLGGPELPKHRAMADVKRAQYVHTYFMNAFHDSLKRKRESELLASSVKESREILLKTAEFEGEPRDANGAPTTHPKDET